MVTGSASRSPFRDFQVAAPLKLNGGSLPKPAVCRFPRLPSRGSIEARDAPRFLIPRSIFPRLPSRGSIEAGSDLQERYVGDHLSATSKSRLH